MPRSRKAQTLQVIHTENESIAYTYAIESSSEEEDNFVEALSESIWEGSSEGI
ncbi:hypothetical protein L211DRAFT_838573 [Terfezia boudieri ATCC MYA-4762]|uniref:Uncharacterized protein n=1 Tax=Terfezia boudieri ATCC MYA-4762 TaxID=1051890 RepID=A0A3N4LKL0_9PEZI|nr:hypothetical protein L211DRAFT_838573 [Terfezia boudieri ATCC MYA-4762]